ncbi:hypothetical protein O9G_005587 [Rozella allomycis CSF55]|uniref:Uncharacterized protein n=1 Tax=Rozella allomycis (strain CSF55) TaxID=988480 RepID=A0A075B4Y7_ROZAC|nr:hypothetical protein O9G_005587 [Rozella allomycis CSF55]|eukprot:EPZ36761.1 hypothetical protein O9G_005587 [Rozella allomycis CSF55]
MFISEKPEFFDDVFELTRKIYRSQSPTNSSYRIPSGRTKAETLLLEEEFFKKYEDLGNMIFQVEELRKEKEILKKEVHESMIQLRRMRRIFKEADSLLSDVLKGMASLEEEDYFLDVSQFSDVEKREAREELEWAMVFVHTSCIFGFQEKHSSFGEFPFHYDDEWPNSDSWSIADTIEQIEKIKSMVDTIWRDVLRRADLIREIMNVKMRDIPRCLVISSAKEFDERNKSETKENRLSHVEYYSNLRPYKFDEEIVKRWQKFSDKYLPKE